MNKIILTGHLGRDPETSQTNKGTSVTKFSIAVDDGYGDYKRTDWFNVVVWGNTAEAASKYLSKGSKVLVEGAMQEQEYQKDGETKKYWQVNVGTSGKLEFLDTRPKEDDQTERRPSSSTRSTKSTQSTNRGPQRSTKDAWDNPAQSTQIQDEDIPF